MPKVSSNDICPAVTLIDFVLKKMGTLVHKNKC